MQSIILSALLLGAAAASGSDIAERIQPDLDAFVFCVLDASVGALPSETSSESIANSAADSCLKELDALERAAAAQYRSVNAGVWPDGKAEQVARENRDEYRNLAIQAAVKVLDEKRATQ